MIIFAAMKKIEFDKACVELTTFKPTNGVSEYHMMVHVTDTTLTYEEQVEALLDAYSAVLQQLPGAVTVFKRYFMSDAANQLDMLLATTTEGTDCALSMVQQAPLDGSKIALWAYLMTDVHVRALSNGLFEAKHGAYRHLWTGSNNNHAATSEYQMRLLLNEYVMNLMQEGCTLADNCMRTWIFVQNIDNNYAGVVKARNEVFMTQNLTSETHFIASTGIGGRMADPKTLVQMDAYAVDGIGKEQIHYLYARTHLNPTYEYGVSFERGTYIDYGDRRQVLISGTASINNKGEIMYRGDVCQQAMRLCENVEMLLAEAGCTFDDTLQMIVYLRDIADYSVVKTLFDERFPDKPKVLVNAPVCRSGWLVEMECIAVKAQTDERFAAL